MKNHLLSQWVEVRKWKLSLDVFLGWDPTKKKGRNSRLWVMCDIHQTNRNDHWPTGRCGENGRPRGEENSGNIRRRSVFPILHKNIRPAATPWAADVDGMRKCRRRSNEKRKKITDGQPQQLTDWRNLFLTIFSPQFSWNFLRALTEWPSVGSFNFADLFKFYFLVHLF